MNKLKEKRDKDLCEFYLQCQSLELTSEKFYLKDQRVRQILKHNKIELPKIKKEQKLKESNITKTIADTAQEAFQIRNNKILIMYLENYSSAAVGKVFSMSRERVRQILNEMGVKPRSSTQRSFKMKKPRMTTRERFWSFVDKTGGEDACWIWTGYTHPVSGYGIFSGRKLLKQERYTHRIAYRLGYFKKPTLWVLHHCDNPSCVNPKHLYDGTAKDNAQDRERRGRGGVLARYRAQNIGKFTERNKTIFRLFTSGVSAFDIAKQFNLKLRYVQAMVYGKNGKKLADSLVL